MGRPKSVYQEEIYLRALNLSGKRLVKISEDLFALERNLKLPLVGRRTILEARGIKDRTALMKFQEKADKYFYGTIAPTVVNKDLTNFEEAEMKKISNYTILIDLKKTKEGLWKNLEKKSIRWGINFASKNRLKVSLTDKEEETNEFYGLYEKTAVEGKFEKEGKGYLLSLSNTPLSKLFLVKQEGDIIAGGLLLLDWKNNYSILDLTASSKEGLRLQAMPFLYWELILYSKEMGLDFIDLGGYDNEAKEGEKTYNINRFKERFGGEVIEQPVYSTNWKYFFLRAILKHFRFLGKWKKG